MPFVDNDGIKIHYEVIGEGSPLIMQHGFMDNLDEWKNYGYADELKEKYKLILIDLRGHGLSDKPHDSKLYTLEVLTSDTIAVLDDLEIKKTHFWGYSMGGHIGFALACQYPDRFLSFIVGGITPQPVDDELKLKIIDFHQLFKGKGEGYLTYLKSNGIEITSEISQEVEDTDFEALDAFWGADIFVEDDRHMVALHMPIFLYNGEEDRWGHHPRGVEYGKARTNVTYVSIPNKGHEVQSHKDLVLPHVVNFLQDLR